MRLVDNYNYLPGCCWLCRGVAKPIIDTELDLDGINSPDDDNPSAINRFYICADCGIEIGRMVASSRSLEISRLGELHLARNLAEEQSNRAEIAEERLAAIAGAVAGVTLPPAETAGSVDVPGGDDQQTDISHPDAPPLRRRGRPRREQPIPEEETINTDFVGDL